jgi:hypothetical protein
VAQLSNYAICYEAIQRVYRNAIIRKARHALQKDDDWLNRVEKVFQKEWGGVLDAAREIREAGGLDASLVDDFDCLGVNHFHNLFDAFFDDLFPRTSRTSESVRNEKRRAVLRFAKEVNDYRNAMSHPSEEDLPARDARRLLDSAYRLLRMIDEVDAATQILGYEEQLMPLQAPPPPSPPPVHRSERERAYHQFFSSVLKRVNEISPGFSKVESVGYANWIGFGTGTSGFGISVVISRPDLLRVELYISTGDAEKNRRALAILRESEAELTGELGETLTFQQMNKDCRIDAKFERAVDPANPPDGAVDWAADLAIRFRQVFGPLVRELDLGELRDDDAD